MELYISGKLIEQVPFDYDACKSYEERKSKVQSISQWLKYRYRDSMIIKPNWEISIRVESKMNSINKLKDVKHARLD